MVQSDQRLRDIVVESLLDSENLLELKGTIRMLHIDETYVVKRKYD